MEENKENMMDNIVVDITEEPRTSNQNPAQEEYTISDLLFIEEGETLVFENKDIHVKAIIRNKGRLEFRNCTVHYGEEEVSDEIHLDNQQAEVVAVDCKFICHSSDEVFFINGVNGGIATFDGCTFEDCLFFAGEMSIIRMRNCMIHNCGPKFVSCRVGSNCVIVGNRIVYDYLSDHLLTYMKKRTSHSPVFYCYHQEAVIRENTVVCEADFYSRYPFDHAIFGAKGDSISKCFFSNVHKCLSVMDGTVIDCIFEYCTDAVKAMGSWSVSVRNSDFAYCERCISSYQKTTVEQCRFTDCKNQLICGGTSSAIRYCTFKDCVTEKEEVGEGLIAALYSLSQENKSIIYISHSKKKDATAWVEFCKFENIRLEEAYIIATGIRFKNEHAVYVNACDFINCTTEREDGKLIHETAGYIPKFHKSPKSVHAIHLSQCKGVPCEVRFVARKE